MRFNDGPSCSTVIYPPAIYEAAYTVGALINNTDFIAPFSSRGPVIIDESGRVKPDITAPGTNIRSALTPAMMLRWFFQRYVHGDPAHFRRDGAAVVSHSEP